MTDPLLEERIEILRRIAERGLEHAAQHWVASNFLSRPWNSQIDSWQHMLDEIGRLVPPTCECGHPRDMHSRGGWTEYPLCAIGGCGCDEWRPNPKP